MISTKGPTEDHRRYSQDPQSSNAVGQACEQPRLLIV